MESIHDGLRAYTYNGTSFTNTAFIDDGDSPLGVAVGSDGTVFLANGRDGLRAYEYSGFTTSLSDKTTQPVHNFNLVQNYPNPFNPSTTIEYQLPKTSRVDLGIYNLFGQKVATLVNKKQPAGNYSVEWEASGFSSGFYIYTLETSAGFTQSKKLLLLK